MTQSQEPSILETWAENPKAAIAAGLVGAVIGGAATLGIVSITAAGEEPPIRVRNGSIELHVGQKGKKWKKVNNNDNKIWRIKDGGDRDSDQYEIFIGASSQSSDCAAGTIATADTITLTYDDNNKVVVKSQAGPPYQTRITADADLAFVPNTDERTVTYGTTASSGFIKKIEAGATVCNYNAKDNNLKIVILEPW